MTSSVKRALPILFALLVGCGPVRATVGVVDAERVYKDAAAAGAEHAAPYPYELAGRLLAQAKDEQGYADWSESFRLAGEAQKYAEQALAQARSTPQAPILAPEPTAEPAVDAAPEPAAEPATEPVVEPAADEPAPEPADDDDSAAEPAPAPADASNPWQAPK